MLIKYACLGCGIEFEAQDWRKRKYCSKKCKGLHNTGGQFDKGHKWSEEIEKRRLKSIKENPSYGMQGKKHSNETKKQMSLSSLKPYNFIDGGYKGKILTAKCSKCNETRNIIIHHIDGNRQNNELKNLKALCRRCHSKTHFPDGRFGINMGEKK